MLRLDVKKKMFLVNFQKKRRMIGWRWMAKSKYFRRPSHARSNQAHPARSPRGMSSTTPESHNGIFQEMTGCRFKHKPLENTSDHRSQCRFLVKSHRNPTMPSSDNIRLSLRTLLPTSRSLFRQSASGRYRRVPEAGPSSIQWSGRFQPERYSPWRSPVHGRRHAAQDAGIPVHGHKYLGRVNWIISFSSS